MNSKAMPAAIGVDAARLHARFDHVEWCRHERSRHTCNKSRHQVVQRPCIYIHHMICERHVEKYMSHTHVI